MKKRTKLGIKIFAVMLICIISIGGFVGNYFYNLALNPNTPKDMIFASEDDSSDLEVKSDVDWLLNNSNYSDTYITSFDNFVNPTDYIKSIMPTHTNIITLAFSMSSKIWN